MSCKCKIPNKKIQPAPCFKSFIPGNGIQFEPINKRVTKINADAAFSQHIFVDPLFPDDIKNDDFLLKVQSVNYLAFFSTDYMATMFSVIFSTKIDEPNLLKSSATIGFPTPKVYPLSFDCWYNTLFPMYQLDITIETLSMIDFDSFGITEPEKYIGGNIFT